MNSKKKIIFYIDWTDCLAHLTGDEAYSIGETKEERRNYTRCQVNNFFKELKNLSKKFEVDIHCITGGSVEYLNGNGDGWISLIHELFKNAGFSNTFKSVATEYGGDLLVGSEMKLLERPFKESKILSTEKLLKDIHDIIPSEIEPMVELSLYKYFANIRFEKEDMTEEEFNYYYAIISDFKNRELYDLYPYYCPGYGVEIDVLPKGFNKELAVENINSLFYNDTPKDKIALSVFNGDFADIDLRMVDHSLTENVLFVGSMDANIQNSLQGKSLPYNIGGYKIEAITKIMRWLSICDLEKIPFNKEGYRYGR